MSRSFSAEPTASATSTGAKPGSTGVSMRGSVPVLLEHDVAAAPDEQRAGVARRRRRSTACCDRRGIHAGFARRHARLRRTRLQRHDHGSRAPVDVQRQNQRPRARAPQCGPRSMHFCSCIPQRMARNSARPARAPERAWCAPAILRDDAWRSRSCRPLRASAFSRRARSARVARSSPAKGSSSSASAGSRAQARANNTRRACPYDISASVRLRRPKIPKRRSARSACRRSAAVIGSLSPMLA